MKHVAAIEDENPCARCGSTRHGSGAHTRLTWAMRNFEPWGIGWESESGAPGEPSHSERSLVLPDLLRIVPCTIGVYGAKGSEGRLPAILRLWSEADPARGYTFMLSCESLDLPEGVSSFLDELCGGRGSLGTVELRFSPTTPSSERCTT